MQTRETAEDLFRRVGLQDPMRGLVQALDNRLDRESDQTMPLQGADVQRWQQLVRAGFCATLGFWGTSAGPTKHGTSCSLL